MKHNQPLLRAMLTGLLLFCGSKLQAQYTFYCTNDMQGNLAPNPGFEDYTSCPNDVSEMDLAAPWFRPTDGTSDYYNACDTVTSSQNWLMGVPVNTIGNRTAHGGVAYAGFYAFLSSSEYREYVEAPLLAPLLAHHTYSVSFWVAYTPAWSGVAVDNLGACCSTSPLWNFATDAHLPATPQVRNSAGSFLTSPDWTLIQGTFAAQGGEAWITIGNFYGDPNTPTILAGNSRTGDAYYYLDDVSVVDVTLCTNSCVNSNGCISISNPDNIVVYTCSNSCPVNYLVGVIDNCCSGCVTLTSFPPSGYNFPLGTTTVTSTASDTLGNSNSCSFTVTVIQETPAPIVVTAFPYPLVVTPCSYICVTIPDESFVVQTASFTT